MVAAFTTNTFLFLLRLRATVGLARRPSPNSPVWRRIIVLRGRVVYNLRQRISLALQRHLSILTLDHLAEAPTAGSGGAPVVVAHGDICVGVMGSDVFREYTTLSLLLLWHLLMSSPTN
jgi:hypothetical protein